MGGSGRRPGVSGGHPARFSGGPRAILELLFEHFELISFCLVILVRKKVFRSSMQGWDITQVVNERQGPSTGRQKLTSCSLGNAA